MEHDIEPPDESRRAFLKGARGVGALSVLAAAAASGAAEAAPAPAPEPAPEAKGYRVTEHIQKYYRTARYW